MLRGENEILPNQSINQSQLINQSITQSINQSLNPSVHPSIHQSVSQSNKQFTSDSSSSSQHSSCAKVPRDWQRRRQVLEIGAPCRTYNEIWGRAPGRIQGLCWPYISLLTLCPPCRGAHLMAVLQFAVRRMNTDCTVFEDKQDFLLI